MFELYRFYRCLSLSKQRIIASLIVSYDFGLVFLNSAVGFKVFPRCEIHGVLKHDRISRLLMDHWLGSLTSSQFLSYDKRI